MHRIEDFDACGSGYFDLWLRVRHWGYSLGLLVPEQHPWTVDRRVITCTDNRAFEQQLTVGKEYTILSCDDDRLLVRVVNDEQRHRWYPYKHFQFTVRPARQLIQKSEDTD